MRNGALTSWNLMTGQNFKHEFFYSSKFYQDIYAIMHARRCDRKPEQIKCFGECSALWVLRVIICILVIIFHILFSEYVCISVLNIGRSLHVISIIFIYNFIHKIWISSFVPLHPHKQIKTTKKAFFIITKSWSSNNKFKYVCDTMEIWYFFHTTSLLSYTPLMLAFTEA